MVAEIRGALDAYPREQLQEILAWVFKEYVVEGGAAPAQGALAMLDARTELEGLSFAELVTLAAAAPRRAGAGGARGAGRARVSVRVGRALDPDRGGATPDPQPVAPPAARADAALTPARARTPATVGDASPAGGAVPVGRTDARRRRHPRRRTRGRDTAPEPAKPEEKKDDGASSRFSWLEVD